MNAPASRPPITTAELVEEGLRCRALWIALVERMIMDATYDTADGAAARSWLAHPDPLVLEAAGLCPDAGRDALLRLIPTSLKPGRRQTPPTGKPTARPVERSTRVDSAEPQQGLPDAR